MGGVWERMIGDCRRILDSLLSEHSSHLTHEVLVTFLAEVCAIVNARPLAPVSNDTECPQILSLNALLTQKLDSRSDLSVSSGQGNIFTSQRKFVQNLADRFWNRRRSEYLHTLQKRVKWQDIQPNLRNGDVVLLLDDESCRNSWPVGLVLNAIPGKDGQVRKAEVRVIKGGKPVAYTLFIFKCPVVLIVG